MDAALIVWLAIGCALTLPIYFWLFIAPLVRLMRYLAGKSKYATTPLFTQDSPAGASGN